MVQLKKENTGTGNIKVVDSVWVTQQNAPTQGVNKLNTPDPNYASVRETKPTNTWDVDTRSLSKRFVDDVIKPYGPEDIKEGKVSDVIKIGSELRPEDTFEETAWGWNYDYDRAVSQERNQQGSLNALQWTGHVAGIPERNVGGLNQYTAPEQGRNVASILPNTGARLEPIDVNNPQATQGTSWANTSNVATWGFNGTTTTAENQRQLKNADVNFSQYGDDSSAPNQATRWGENEKYTWDFVKNSNLGYDPNIRTSDLDPNYMFWMDAQWANTDSAGYIARRNDMIASALFNDAVADGRLPTKDDVINYLSQQDGWMNSTEADRFNTIESIWKRLGGLANQTQEWPDMNNIPATYSDEALNNMENDLNQSTAWELYGKVTADQSTHITTLEDDNSVYKSMNEARINAYKQLRGMDSQAIAAAIVSNSMASDSQVMRDLMQYDPDKYQYVMQAVKQMRGQMNINAITSGKWDMTTSATGGSSTMTSEISDFATSNSTSTTSSADILNSVNNTLSSNQNYATASEQMASIENDMARLNNRLQNLSKEANTVFKWDVPQYIVNAYIANRTAEIQNEMSILENRYNAAQSRQQNEWEKTKWEAEFDLKKQEFELKKQNAVYDNWATQQGIALKMAEFNQKYWTNGWPSIAASSLSRDQIWSAVDSLVTMYNNWQLGNAQCAAGIQKYYLPQIGVNLGSLSDWSNKQAICNELAWEYSPRKWDIVVMSSSSSPQYWHMWVVVGFDGSDMVYLDWNGSLGENWVGTETPKLRKMSVNNSKIYGYYNPTKAIGGNSSLDTLTWHGTTYNLASYSGWNSLSDAAKETVRWLLTYQINPDSLPKTGENWVYKTQVLNAASEIGREQWRNDKKASQINKYIEWWNKALNQWWVGSANSTAASLLWELSEQFKDFNKYDIQTVNGWLNIMSQEFWGSWTMATYADLNVAAAELAKALKGNASATEQEKKDIAALLSGKMSNAQAQEVFKHFAKDLVDKNASEALHYKRVAGYKPDPIYIDEVADWMNNELWVDMSRYYDYNPSGWWSVFGASSGDLSSDQMVNNIFNY